MTAPCSCVACCARHQTGWDTQPLEERARRFENMAHETFKRGGTDCAGLTLLLFTAASLLREAIERMPTGDGK